MDDVLYRVLGVNFIAGAVLGLVMMVQSVGLGQLGINQPVTILLLTGTSFWFGRLGVLILERRPDCLDKAKKAFLFLIPSFSGGVLSYDMFSGFTINVSIQFSPTLGTGAYWTLSGGFNFGLNQPDMPFAIGIDIVALAFWGLLAVYAGQLKEGEERK